MTKRPLIWVFLPLFLGVFWVALGSAPVQAAVVYSTDFENFNIGELNGQGGWTTYANNAWKIQTNYSHSGIKAISPIGTGVGWWALAPAVENISEGYVEFWFNELQVSTPTYGRQIGFWGSEGAFLNIVICHTLSYCSDTPMKIVLEGAPGGPIVCSWTPNTWTKIGIEWQTNRYRARCDDGTPTDWISKNIGTANGRIEILGMGYTDTGGIFDDVKIGTGSLPPAGTYSISISRPVDSSTIADFDDWLLNYQYFGGDASSTNVVDLVFLVAAAATSSENAVGYYQDWSSVLDLPDNSTMTRVLSIPKANVLFSNHQWWAWAKLYYWGDPEPLAESAEISFYVSTSTRAWPYPGTTTEETLGFLCGAYTFPVNQMCNAAEWLIVPQRSDLDVFNSVRDEFALKAPIGYFTAAKDIINTLKSGTPTIEIAVLSVIMDPLIAGLIWVLWFLFLFWLFRRISNLDI